MPARVFAPYAKKFLEQRLEADSVLLTELPGGFFNEAAEQGTVGRVGLYRHRSTARPQEFDRQGAYQIVNNDLVYVIVVYLVCAVGENEPIENLIPAAERIFSLLRNTSGSVTGATIPWCQWLAEHNELKYEGDQFYPELGSYWAIAVQPV